MLFMKDTIKRKHCLKNKTWLHMSGLLKITWMYVPYCLRWYNLWIHHVLKKEPTAHRDLWIH